MSEVSWIIIPFFRRAFVDGQFLQYPFCSNALRFLKTPDVPAGPGMYPEWQPHWVKIALVNSILSLYKLLE